MWVHEQASGVKLSKARWWEELDQAKGGCHKRGAFLAREGERELSKLEG